MFNATSQDHKESTEAQHSSKTQRAECPFAVDSSDCKEHGTDYRARQLSHEELIWEATTSHGRPLKLSTYSGLIPSDCMWFDSGSQRILEVFPARQHLGRYSS